MENFEIKVGNNIHLKILSKIEQCVDLKEDL